MEGIMDVRAHRRLEVWQQSLVLVKKVYKFTEAFPKSEQFGLTSEIRRAAVSIPSNLAEGAGRKGKKEFGYFLNVA
jgi:four helix bundle protein